MDSLHLDIAANWSKHFPNFKPHEVLSPDGMRALERNVLVIQPYAVKLLQTLRDLVGPLTVNSMTSQRRGYRSPRENRKVGGGEFSYHMQGIAFDVTGRDIALERLAEEAIGVGFTGIFLYPHQNFVHLDVRPIYKGKPEMRYAQ